MTYGDRRSMLPAGRGEQYVFSGTFESGPVGQRISEEFCFPFEVRNVRLSWAEQSLDPWANALVAQILDGVGFPSEWVKQSGVS